MLVLILLLLLLLFYERKSCDIVQYIGICDHILCIEMRHFVFGVRHTLTHTYACTFTHSLSANRCVQIKKGPTTTITTTAYTKLTCWNAYSNSNNSGAGHAHCTHKQLCLSLCVCTFVCWIFNWKCACMFLLQQRQRQRQQQQSVSLLSASSKSHKWVWLTLYNLFHLFFLCECMCVSSTLSFFFTLKSIYKMYI